MQFDAVDTSKPGIVGIDFQCFFDLYLGFVKSAM